MRCAPCRRWPGEHALRTSLAFLGDGREDYLIQRAPEDDGLLMFGGGRQAGGETVNVWDDSVIDEQTAKYLRRDLVPALGLPETPTTELQPTHEWTGIMAFSRDDLPWVGPVPGHARLYICAGYTGNGIPNAWLCGRALAAMIRTTLGCEMSGDEDATGAAREVGLPSRYMITRRRIDRAMQKESVAVRDTQEFESDSSR